MESGVAMTADKSDGFDKRFVMHPLNATALPLLDENWDFLYERDFVVNDVKSREKHNQRVGDELNLFQARIYFQDK